MAWRCYDGATEAYYSKSELITVKWQRCEVAVRRRKVALRLYCPITASSLQNGGKKKMKWNDHVTCHLRL